MQLFDLSHSIAGKYLLETEDSYQFIPKINDIIKKIIPTLNDDFVQVKYGVYVHKSAVISASAKIDGLAIICARAELRHCSFIRGNAIIGEDTVIGNSCEVKNAIIFDNAQIPHFNYVGDSIVGFKSHLGAGVILSNLKSDKSNVNIIVDGVKRDSGFRKLGSLIGDCAEIGCNSVLNPGTIIGKKATIYPLTMVRGTVEENSIYKNNGQIVKK